MQFLVRRIFAIVSVAAVLTLLAGCFGISQNPSYFPHLLPTGDIIRTHARPPGCSYLSNFDPHARRLEVRPFAATNPVQTQHVLIATIYDEKGEPRRNRRIEWMLEGAGNIIEVDESGYFPGRGYKVDNKYAVSYTDYIEHRITRNNPNPNDDFVIRPGQSWCVVSSAAEGDTQVSVYAPEIADWDARKVTVTMNWVDAEWALPPPGVARAGGQHVFTTRIFRHTDHQPIANYRVRYRLVDGPPAGFLPGPGSETVAISDLSGNATVTLAEAAPAGGINHIAIEIVRPPDPRSPSGAGVVIGQGQTTMEWQAPSISLAHTGPPTAVVGQDIVYTIAVRSSGSMVTQPMTVRNAIPGGAQYVRSDPPAVVEGKQLTWTLGALAPGQAHTIQVILQGSRPGTLTNCATATTVDGLHAEGCATTQVTAPGLSVAMTGPTTGAVGAPITYQITVTNSGSGSASNVVLSDRFDPGLEHESRANPVELRIGTLGTREARTVAITLVPRQAGRLLNRVDAHADGGLQALAEHAVDVQAARLGVTMTGPAIRYVGRPPIFDIRVENAGDLPLRNVAVRDHLPAELEFASATDGGQFGNGQVLWAIGALNPRQQRQFQVSTRCLKIAPNVVNTAVATAETGMQMQAHSALDILGLPAFRLEVLDVVDPVPVGGTTTYKIDVTNQGSLPGDKVEIVATVPPQMRVTNARGPSTPQIEGPHVIFPPVDGLQSRQTFSYSVEVQAVEPGDARLHVELRAATLQDPVIKEESTIVFAAIPGAGEAPNAPSKPPSPPPPSAAVPPPSG
jgi:uncharacterized repeat protein (TIGR01451 family)